MLYTAFILGLISSFHCVGMCGAISVMLPVDHQNSVKKFFQLMVYHVGKITAYAFIGLLFGLLGKGLFLAGIQQQLSIIIGLVIILIALIPERILSKYSITQPLYQLIGKVKSSLGSQFKKKSLSALFTIGLLNGFLPCGMVYMAVFGAMAMQDQIWGTLYMMLFGLGTIPLLMIVAYAQHMISISLRNRIQKLIPAVAVCIGMLFILRGLGLGIPYVSPANTHLRVLESSACVTP